MTSKLPAPKRRGGLRHIAPSAVKAARPALRKRGLAVAGIVTDWRQIVGSFLADATAPEKLIPGRSGPRGGCEPGVLYLRVDNPSLALEITHLSPQVIERVNGYFGYKAVGRLHIRQAPVNRPPRRCDLSSTPAPSAVDKNAIRVETARIDDERLREALKCLGETIAARRDRT
ncbi:MAG: DciA family protein [Rhodospirillaceae bacterium]|nr:DciA family protein [Rhodospirillaceae bacterium]